MSNRISHYYFTGWPHSVADIITNLNATKNALRHRRQTRHSWLHRKTRDERPSKYAAESLPLTLSTDSETQTITPALIAAVACCDSNEDTNAYIERHGLDGLLSHSNTPTNTSKERSPIALQPANSISPHLRPESSSRRSNPSPTLTAIMPHGDGLR
jgi:hypothetical protein